MYIRIKIECVSGRQSKIDFNQKRNRLRKNKNMKSQNSCLIKSNVYPYESEQKRNEYQDQNQKASFMATMSDKDTIFECKEATLLSSEIKYTFTKIPSIN